MEVCFSYFCLVASQSLRIHQNIKSLREFEFDPNDRFQVHCSFARPICGLLTFLFSSCLQSPKRLINRDSLIEQTLDKPSELLRFDRIQLLAVPGFRLCIHLVCW